MKHRFVILLALGSASACAWLVSACGGADNTNIDGGNDATTSDSPTTDSQTTSDSPTNNDGGTNDAANNDASCQKGTTTNCRQCCAALYPDAAAFFVATEESCACTTPGDCKNQCGTTLCQGKQPGAQSPCEACINNKDAGDCFATTVATCTANVECQALEVCIAKCNGPTDAGGGG